MRLIDFFDRIYVIHLPERVDRYHALQGELANIGIDIRDPKVRFPAPPYPTDAHGFPSLGVYSNFIRHLGILKECLADGVEQMLILEDDAIFRHQLRDEANQEQIIQRLSQDDWGMCFLGHKIAKHELRSHDQGLTPFHGEFQWAHCYSVHARILPQLIAYMEETLVNPADHPRGGKMYIDGAYNVFRKLHPEVVTLVSNPNLSSQKGCLSSLADRRWYDKFNVLQPMITSVRALRDEAWRSSLV